MISPGCVVRVHRHGDIAWVVASKMFDGRWRCISKAVGTKNGVAFNGLTAGEGDCVLVSPAPTFEPGAKVLYGGREHIVIEDKGEFVILSIPASSRALRGGGALSIPSGNSALIAKSDLVLEQLE